MGDEAVLHRPSFRLPLSDFLLPAGLGVLTWGLVKLAESAGLTGSAALAVGFALPVLLCYLFLFFPGIAIFLWLGAEFAWASWLRNERTVGSSWMPVIYPLKFVIPVAAALLLLQGVSEFLKCLYALRTGEWLTKARTLEELVSHES